MPLQNRMNNLSLHSDTSAVNNPNFPVPFRMRLIEILFNEAGNFPRLESMKIDGVLDGQFYRI